MLVEKIFSKLKKLSSKLWNLSSDKVYIYVVKLLYGAKNKWLLSFAILRLMNFDWHKICWNIKKCPSLNFISLHEELISWPILKILISTMCGSWLYTYFRDLLVVVMYLPSIWIPWTAANATKDGGKQISSDRICKCLLHPCHFMKSFENAITHLESTSSIQKQTVRCVMVGTQVDRAIFDDGANRFVKPL